MFDTWMGKIDDLEKEINEKINGKTPLLTPNKNLVALFFLYFININKIRMRIF